MTNSSGGYFGVDGVIGGYSYWQNSYDPHADYANSNFDVPNNFSGTVLYRPPFGHEKQFGAKCNPLTDEALGGWAQAANALLPSAVPINIYTNPSDGPN